MKVRHGFVSNSSSSSFVVLLPKTDEYGSLTSHSLRELLFGPPPTNLQNGELDALAVYDHAYDKNHIADVISKDLNEKKFIGFSYTPITKKEYKRLFDAMCQDLMQYITYYVFPRYDSYSSVPDVHPIFQPLIEELKVIGKEPEREYKHGMSETEQRDHWKKEWEIQEKWRKKSLKVIRPALKKFLDEVQKNHDVYITEYSDNDGAFWSAMEHGGIFDNVPHMRFSHH